MRVWVVSGALWLLAASGVARADVYSWVDESGAEHFTNSMQSIPEERRAGARVMMTEKTTGGAASAAPEPGKVHALPGVGGSPALPGVGKSEPLKRPPQ